jgi:hypothetical protein
VGDNVSGDGVDGAARPVCRGCSTDWHKSHASRQTLHRFTIHGLGHTIGVLHQHHRAEDWIISDECCRQNRASSKTDGHAGFPTLRMMISPSRADHDARVVTSGAVATLPETEIKVQRRTG